MHDLHARRLQLREILKSSQPTRVTCKYHLKLL